MINFDSQQHYYWLHFWALIDSLEERLGDLLSVEDSLWITNLRKLPFHAQLCYIRLLNRKPGALAKHKLNYSEIDDFEHCLSILADRKLLSIGSDNWQDYCECLNKAELIRCVRSDEALIKSLKKLKKLELHQQLYDLELIENPEYSVLRVAANPWLKFQAWYFENSRQQFSEFVVSDIGNIRYEDYRVDKTTRVWQSNSQLEDYWRLLQITSQFEEKLPCSDEDLKWLTSNSFELRKLKRLQRRIIDNIARDLERQQLLPQALALYALSDSPFAIERQIRIWVQIEDYDAANRRLQWCLSQPNDSLQRFALGFSYQKRKRLGINASPPIKYQPEVVELNWYGSDLRPEQQALAQLAEYGWQGWHLENSLINSIFGLSFWAVVFANKAGAFSHPYQLMPHDMFALDFAAQRESELAQAWQEFESDDWFEHVQNCYRQKHSIANPWVDWKRVSLSVLTSVLTHIPKSVWRRLFERLWLDLRHYRSGMPDLFVIKDTQICWLEVKSPSDSLSNHQRDWLHFLRRDLLQNAFVCDLKTQALTLDEQSFAHKLNPN